MSINTIIFDLDDTLLWDKKSVKTAFEKTCDYAATVHHVNPAELEEAVRREARALYEGYETYDYTVLIGINPFEGLWGTFDDATDSFKKMKEIVPSYRAAAWTKGLAALGIEDTAFGAELGERFVAERKVAPFLYEDTFAVLDELKGKYQLVLLTNGAPSLQNLKLEITPEIAPYFDHIIISGDFGKGKPDASIFEYVMEKVGITADEAIMVGDNLNTDILGSSRVGMRNVWINRENHIADGAVIPSYEVDSLTALMELVNKL
ncbi:MAG TPA: HAD family hydrolase [Lysinibacillus sp.]|jgi:putative hydrolase of the HAD superfamily|uniref:Phosphoserine phosphatase n=1 Tax=Lysinibacillus fusiformis TaxID=28031 RepID=A0A2I0V327_9BACI|nr:MULTISPECIES: HAD family hydrolase [Lysinibacillus]HBT71030.1 HAD family hydrolase [Lysinibacillus sp.]KUF37006.1 haloacid dehalogenase [Lysinibacillus sp. F5]PKU52699.1 HAD family hydrolase [Lysinibacillus fusiformis]WCH47139.1 HAD family hydrolase [Lysinibacillus sp. OF-1]SCY89295.1 putative hydrolase of the HAD superfamily [Lysinibacillus sp. SG9]